jgi:hypothetical protein
MVVPAVAGLMPRSEVNRAFSITDTMDFSQAETTSVLASETDTDAT